MAMASRHSDMVASVCCHSPALIHPFDPDEYASAVPMWIVHGKRDGTVAYNGSFPANDPSGPYYVPGAIQVNDILGQVNGCVGNVSESMVLNDDGTTLRRQTNCTNNATVELLSLETAGHTPFLGVPVFDQGQTPDSNLGAEVTTVDTTEMAWQFCSSYVSETEPVLIQVTPPPTAVVATMSPSTASSPSAPTKVPSTSAPALSYGCSKFDLQQTPALTHAAALLLLYLFVR